MAKRKLVKYKEGAKSLTKKQKIERGARSFAIRFEGVMRDLSKS